MTVSSTTNKQSYNGNGSQSVFAYTFKIFAEADVEVYVGTTLKTLSTHYTLSGVGATGGGNVTFTSGNIPAAGTGNVTILRSLALTQGVDLINYGKFDAEVVEAQYDKIVMMIQQLQEQADRTIRFNTTVSDAGGVEITDTVAERSNKVLAYDNAGDLSVANELGEWKGNWATNTAFSTRDLVLDAATNNVYICLVAHTSGTLSSDVSASKWALVINAAAVAASAATATTKASEASTSASTASTQATNSANSATAAASSASTASTQASTATTKANTATTKASEASTSASNAATSASAGATSATNAANSATAGANSATASANSASGASTSASTATTKASEASTSASTATTKASEGATSATNSANSATASANSATASANSATASANSASTAGTQATNSANSATASANSAASAAAAFDSFDDRYLGAKSSEVSVNNDGDALVVGNLYFLTGTGMQVYDGANWIAASSSGNVSMYVYEYIATANQTTFSGADSNSQTLSYAAGNIIVSYGGYDLPKSDYTATNGTSVVLDDGAVVGEIVRIVAFQSFVVANTYTQSQADVLLAAKSPLASPVFTGNVGIGGSPVGKLSISGTTATNEASHVTFQNTSGAKIFAVGGGKSGVSNNGFNIVNVTDNTAPLTISDSGNVGIGGITTVNQKLAVKVGDDIIVGVWGDNSAGYGAIQSANVANNAYKQLRFDASSYHFAQGNVGVGVAPETDWTSSFDVIQYGQAGVLWANNNDNSARLGMNVKYDGAYKYINTNKAVNLTLDSVGQFLFDVAPSGSADSAISWTTAMTIANTGHVGILATPSTSGRLVVAASTTKHGLEISNHSYYSPNAMRVINSDTINRAGHEIIFNRGGSDVGSISTSTSSTSYNVNSDYRLKENVTPMSGATAQTKLLKPCNFDWIIGGNVNGFLAHELAEVVPEAVTGTKDAMKDEEYEVTPAVVDDEGNETTAAVMGTRSVPDMQGIDQSKLVPLLTATIQELISRIEALENN